MQPDLKIRYVVGIGAALMLSLSAALAQVVSVDLKSLATNYGLSPVTLTNAPAQSRWKSDSVQLTFTLGSRKLLFNDRIIWMNGGTTTNRTGAFAISLADADSVVRPLLRPREVLEGRRVKVVMLDPGHGGKDPGAIGCSQLREKAVVLDIARRVARILRTKHIAVRLTRSRDAFVDLDRRPVVARQSKADLFVSIHANQAGNKAAAGIETYVMPAAGFCSTSSTHPDITSYPGNTNDAANMVLAAAIQQNVVVKTGARDRGIKRARYLVIKNAPCPAALVEVGFITNRKEADNIINPAYREKVAAGIADGILDYIKSTPDNRLR